MQALGLNMYVNKTSFKQLLYKNWDVVGIYEKLQENDYLNLIEQKP